MKRIFLAAIATNAAVLSVDVWADIIEEVVVTAQKREQSVQDVSISINAFTGDQLRQMGARNVKDMANYVAGVQINEEYGNAPTFTIRGISVNDFYVTTSPTAAVYVDGIYKATSINSGVQIFDIERIEILKGPQGTLWGRNVTGGAVSVITKEPTDQFEAYVDASIGRFNRTVIEGAVSGPVTTNLAARVSAQWQQGDGAYDNVTFPSQPDPRDFTLQPRLSPVQDGGISSFDDKTGDLDYKSFRAQLLYQPTEFLDIRLVGHFTLDQSRNAPVTMMGQLGPDCGVVMDATGFGIPVSGTFDPDDCFDAFGFADPDPFDDKISNDFVPSKDTEVFGGSVHVSWQTDFGEIVSITGYEGFERWGGIDADGSPNQLINGRYHQEHNQYSEELRLESNLGNNITYALGTYLSYDEIKSADGDFSLKGPLGIPPLNSFTNDIDQETLHASLFGQAEWQFAETLNLIAGLRWSWERKDNFHFDQVGLAPSGLLPVIEPLGEEGFIGGSSLAPGASDERTSRDVSYRLGIEWRPLDDSMFYLSHARGVKSGGWDNVILFDQSAFAEFDEEILKSYETGLKWTVSDTMRLNLAAFFYDYENPQQRKGVTLPNGQPQQQLVNVDSADLVGGELEFAWAPLQGLEFLATAAFLESEISDSEDPLIDGNDLPFAPKQAFTLVGRYETPISDNLFASVQSDVSYTGNHFPDAFNVFFEEQNYTQIGARLAVGDQAGKWEVSIWGKNLTDEIYIINSFAGVLSRAFYLSEPRSWGITFRYNVF